MTNKKKKEGKERKTTQWKQKDKENKGEEMAEIRGNYYLKVKTNQKNQKKWLLTYREKVQ